MIQVVLIGSGNLAYCLHTALMEAQGIKLLKIAARNRDNLNAFRPGSPTGGLDEPLPPADIYILALADRAIEPVSRRLSFNNGLVVHTAGAQPLNALPAASRTGVFYPLQSFSKDRPISLGGVPILLETSLGEDLALLERLATALGGNPVVADSTQRLTVHLAAVFTNNFTNHLVHLAQTLCTDKGLSPDILMPLLRETFEKLEQLSPLQAQTGPARRGDMPTLNKHRSLLQDKNLKDIYNRITHSIQNTYEKKL